MSSIKRFIRKAFTPITIMLIPHNNSRSFNFKMPSIGIIFSVAMLLIGSVYVLSIAVNAFEYRMMKEKLGYYSQQFLELKTTIIALKKAESEFKHLFSLGTKEKVLENVHSESGSIDMEALGNQVKNTISTIREIREYLARQKDIYMSTPKGLPVNGNITSYYGMRENPIHGGEDFHSGIDIAADSGAPIRASADGVVSFSGRSGGSGKLVALEHGFGFSTFYAHNSQNLVEVGKLIKRGDIIAYAGSTGNATGPHSHYEIWKDGKHVNPVPYIEGRR